MIAEDVVLPWCDPVCWRLEDFFAAARCVAIDRELIFRLIDSEVLAVPEYQVLSMVRLSEEVDRGGWAKAIGARGWRFAHPAMLVAAVALCPNAALRYPLAAFGAHTRLSDHPSSRRDALYLGLDPAGGRRIGQVWYDGKLGTDWWMLVDTSMAERSGS